MSGSRSHNAPTAPSPRRPSRSDLARDVASWGTLTGDKGIQPANKRAGDSAYVRRARMWSDGCSVESRVVRSHSSSARHRQPRSGASPSRSFVENETHIPLPGSPLESAVLLEKQRPLTSLSSCGALCTCWGAAHEVHDRAWRLCLKCSLLLAAASRQTAGPYGLSCPSTPAQTEPK